MITPTIVLGATRVTTVFMKENDHSRLLVSAFRPTDTCIAALARAKREKSIFLMDIADETGEFTAGAKWIISSLEVADDRKAFTLILTKA